MAKGAAPTYLPPGGSAAGIKPGSGDGMRKFLREEHLGSVVGRVGAGLTTIGGGDQMAHAVNHYGKNALPLLGGGDGSPTQQPEVVE